MRFDRVTCRYDERAGAPALRDVDLQLLAGTTTAIAGASGAGKTTIADLLLGLLTPAQGEIRIDGVRLDPSTLSSWRSQVAYVPQDTFLFHDTVRANLLWAKPEASDGSAAVDHWEDAAHDTAGLAREICLAAHEGRQPDNSRFDSAVAQQALLMCQQRFDPLWLRHCADLIEVEIANDSIFHDVDAPEDLARLRKERAAG